jgi:hypothetical protein
MTSNDGRSLRIFGEEFVCSIDRHAEDVGDGLVAYLDLEGFGVKPGAMTGRTGSVDARKKQQFHAYKPFALARLAAPLATLNENLPAS